MEKALRIYRQANEPGARVIFDADSILRDAGVDVDPGTFPEIAEIYRSTSDPESFDALFEAFTGFKFQDFLTTAINNTSSELAP